MSGCTALRVRLVLALMPRALRFVRVAQLPDELEMVLQEQGLGVSAADADTAFGFCCINKIICSCSHQRFVRACPAPTAS